MSQPWEDYSTATAETPPWTDYAESKPWEDFAKPIDLDVLNRNAAMGERAREYTDSLKSAEFAKNLVFDVPREIGQGVDSLIEPVKPFLNKAVNTLIPGAADIPNDQSLFLPPLPPDKKGFLPSLYRQAEGLTTKESLATLPLLPESEAAKLLFLAPAAGGAVAGAADLATAKTGEERLEAAGNLLGQGAFAALLGRGKHGETPETTPGRANGVSTPVEPDQSSARPAQRATAPPVEVTPDVAKDLIEQLTKGQIRVGEEKRPMTSAERSPSEQVSPAKISPISAENQTEGVRRLKSNDETAPESSVSTDEASSPPKSEPINPRTLGKQIVDVYGVDMARVQANEMDAQAQKDFQSGLFILANGSRARAEGIREAIRNAEAAPSLRTTEPVTEAPATREALTEASPRAPEGSTGDAELSPVTIPEKPNTRLAADRPIREPYSDKHSVSLQVAATDPSTITRESILSSLPQDIASQVETVRKFQGEIVPTNKDVSVPARIELTFPNKEIAQRAIDYFKGTEPDRPLAAEAAPQQPTVAEPQSAPSKPKGKNPFWVRPRSDGVPDILDDIQELGGIRPPGPDAGGEYDGFGEAMTGTARMLVKKSAVHAPDTLIQELHSMGNQLQVQSPDDLWNAIKSAVKDRQKLATTGGGHEAQTVKFWSAVLDPKNKSGLERINMQDLKVGDTFRIRGPGISHEELTVTHLDHDTGDIQVKDGPKLGVQDIPDGTQLWVKREPSVVPTLRTGEKGTAELFQGEDQPFNLSGEKASDGDRIAQEKAKAEATAREAKEIEAKQQQELPGATDHPDPYNLLNRLGDGTLKNIAREVVPGVSEAQGRQTLIDDIAAKIKKRPELYQHARDFLNKSGAWGPHGEPDLSKPFEPTPERPFGSIGSGIKAALEKNQGGEAGFVRIPSRQELLDHFTDLGDQLREAAKYVSGKRRQLVERLKRGGDFDTISYLKDAAENTANLMGKQTGNVVRHELNRAFGVKAERVRKERNDLRESALTFAIEASGDKGRLAEWRYLLTRSEVAPRLWRRRALQAIEFADTHWDKLQPVVETYRRITDAENAYENANGIPTLYREGGYVFHAQDLEATYNIGNGGLVTQGAGGAATPFRKGRDYPTYAEAIANGVNPKSLNGVDLLEHRVSIGQRAVNMTDWIVAMQHIQDKATKLPVVVKPEWVERTGNLGPSHREFEGMPPAKDTQGYYKVPPHYEVIEFGGKTIGLHKGFTGLFSSLTDPSWFQKSAGRKAFAGGMAFAKHTALLFDTYHLGRLAFWNSLSRGVLPHLPSYDRGLSILENTLPELQRMVARGEIPKEWGKGLIESKTRLDAVMRAGGNLSSVGDNLHTEFLQRVPGLGTFNKWLFNKYQRGAMAEVALMEFDRQAKFHPGEDINVTARRVAKDVNTRFGNLQSQAWLKSKTGQDLARVLFLAPQWNESLIRSELGAVKQFGQAGANIARGKRPALGMLARGIGSAALGTFIANQLINLYTRGTPTWDNPEEEAGAKISAWIPDKVGGGPGYFLNPLSLPAEMMNLLYRGIDRHKSEGFTTAISRGVLDMLKSRLSPLAKGIFTWVTGETPMGVKVGHGVGAAVKEALPAPISGGAIYRIGKQVVTGEHQEKYPGEFQKQGMQSVGLKTEQAPDPEHRIRSLAVEFNSRHKVSEDTGAYAPSRFADLIAAIRRQNLSDAKEALDTILTTDKANGEPTKPKDVSAYFKKWESAAFTKAQRRETQFRMTLNAEQRKVYDQARKDRIAIAQKVNAMLKAKVAGSPQAVAP